MTGGVTCDEETEQCHHQTDAITEPLGKQEGWYVRDKLETENSNNGGGGGMKADRDAVQGI